jgi:hypothetical protein
MLLRYFAIGDEMKTIRTELQITLNSEGLVGRTDWCFCCLDGEDKILEVHLYNEDEKSVSILILVLTAISKEVITLPIRIG